MLMRKAITLLFLMTIILGGCSVKQQQTDVEPMFTEVKLTVNPETGQLNEPVTIEAKVTQGGENVEDADEVTFEIWRANDEDHENIEVKHVGKGIYRLEKSFDREGTYYVISHVTARDMHTMPKEEFVIGQPSEPEEDPSSSTMDSEEDENQQ